MRAKIWGQILEERFEIWGGSGVRKNCGDEVEMRDEVRHEMERDEGQDLRGENWEIGEIGPGPLGKRGLEARRNLHLFK